MPTPRCLPLACALIAMAAARSDAARVLLVTQNATINTQESARKTRFEGWGHSVTTINDAASQSAFDTAIAAADVVYISGTVEDWELGAKVKSAPIGVVCEERYLDDDMAFSTGTGWNNSHQNIQILDNTHPVTAGLPTGWVNIFSSSQQVTIMNPTIAAGGAVLARQNYSAGDTLMVFEAGAAMANSFTAPARRVRLPWGVDGFSWSAINGNGLLICRQAIEWAAGGDDLLLHWALDESSGSTALDGSSYGRDGALSAGATRTSAAIRGGGVDVDSAGRIEVADLLGKPTSFTVAAWVDTHAVGAEGGAVVSVGDHVVLLMDQPGSGGLPTIQFDSNGSSSVSVSGGTAAVGAGWRHYAATFDSAANTLKLYIDGELVGTRSTPKEIDWATTLGTTTVAGDNSSAAGGYEFDGQIDDVRVYSRALDAGEVSELFGLVAYWKFDETAGTVATDATGAGHDATHTGAPVWTEGYQGGAAEFNGVAGHFVNTSVADSLNGQNGFSAVVYVRSDVTNQDRDIFFGTAPNGNDNDVSLRYDKAGWGGGGTQIVKAAIRSDQGVAQIEGHSDVQTTRWQQIAVSWRSGEPIRLWVDGEEQTASYEFHPSGGVIAGVTQWMIGNGTKNAEWDGLIDDLKLYNRSLTQSEIESLGDPNLIAHWAFDDGAGTVARDSSVGENDASVAAGTPVWVDGVRGGALQFDGATDLRTVADFDPPETGSVAFWARQTATPSGAQRLLGLTGNWEIRTDPTGAIYCNLAGPAGGSFQSPSATLTPGRWRHVAAVYNSVDDTHSLYVDGQIVSSGAFNSQDESPARLSLGTRTGSNERFNGALDDVRVYGYELTAAEVAELYGLVGHWAFDEGAGTTIADSSSSANDAAFQTGSPLWVRGPRGYALEFDGSSDARTGQPFDPPATGAVAIWLRCESVAGPRQSPWGVSDGFEFRMEPGGSLYGDLSAPGSNTQIALQEPLDNDAWRHVVFQFDAEEDSFEVYADGLLESSGVSSIDIRQQAADFLTLGARTGSAERFRGAIDDLRVYNRWLQPAEIAEVYGRVGWYRMEETTGTVVSDSSGAGNHGAIAGSASWATDAREGAGSLRLDGVDHVQIPSLLVTNPSDGVAIAGWAKLTGADTGGAELVSIGSAFAVRLDDPWAVMGTTAFAYDGTSFGWARSQRYYESAGWRHFAASYDPLTLEVKLYVDGVLRATEALSAPLDLAGVGAVTRIGAHAGAETTRDFTGLVDDIHIYNRAITPEEARALFYGEFVPGLRIVEWVETANP
ncbi:LamG domain-containing protein [Botrimarina sp.]|uniref:LamG domain-containing protein n=1 Tax=Botrimarina sp. TaxID=2795802 RepID=UPI0032EFE68D